MGLHETWYDPHYTHERIKFVIHKVPQYEMAATAEYFKLQP